MAARAAGFPYLRVNRFLASYARENMNDARFAEWMNRMIALGTEAYAVELGNLPADKAEELAHALWNIDARYAWLRPAITECTARLAALDVMDSERRSELRGAANVPADYATWQRIVGLYWISRLPFAAGIRRWHEETRAQYAQPLETLPVKGRLQAYLPPPGSLSLDELAGMLERATANPLCIPDPRRETRSAVPRLRAEFEWTMRARRTSPVSGWGSPILRNRVERRCSIARVAHAFAGRHCTAHTRRSRTAQGRRLYLLGGQLDGVLLLVRSRPTGPWCTIEPCVVLPCSPHARSAPAAIG